MTKLNLKCFYAYSQKIYKIYYHKILLLHYTFFRFLSKILKKFAKSLIQYLFNINQEICIHYCLELPVVIN